MNGFTCPVCKRWRPFRGRRDKRTCSAACRKAKSRLHLESKCDLTSLPLFTYEEE